MLHVGRRLPAPIQIGSSGPVGQLIGTSGANARKAGREYHLPGTIRAMSFSQGRSRIGVGTHTDRCRWPYRRVTRGGIVFSLARSARRRFSRSTARSRANR